jgi:hypothetical protein
VNEIERWRTPNGGRGWSHQGLTRGLRWGAYRPVVPLGLPVKRPLAQPHSPCGEGRRLPPLVEIDDRQRREFHEALLDGDSFEVLPGKWQAAILKAEAARPASKTTRGLPPGEPPSQSLMCSNPA